jgi:hypothetical protein
MEEDEASQQPLSRIVGGERKKIYEYNIEWEVNSASQCIGNNCSLPKGIEKGRKNAVV